MSTVFHFNNILSDMANNFDIGIRYQVYINSKKHSSEFIENFMTIDPDSIKCKNKCLFDNFNLPIEYDNLSRRNKSILWKYLTVLQQLTEKYSNEV
jgi:hypothetical protein